MPPSDDAHRRHRDAAKGVVVSLREEGFTAYFAGGCVRDEVLGLAPKDYDVATSARPDDVKRIFRRVNEVGASFGVMLVRTRGATIEVATFRREGAYTDRRRPDEVEYAGPEEDARRRDFTINALYLDPLAPAKEPFLQVDGEVIDLVEGVEDLACGIVRAVGDADARLAEDDLRALRAVRFAARLGFTIEQSTLEAIERHAGDLVGVSRERIGDELRLMLAHESRTEAAHLMESLGLVKPALDCSAGASPKREDRLLTGLGADSAFTTALVAWTIDRLGSQPMDLGLVEAESKASILRLRSALCLSNEERDSIVGIFDSLVKVGQRWGSMTVAQQKRLAVRPSFDGAMEILRVADPGAAGIVESRIEELAATESGLAPKPLLIGDDLIDLGLTPGPRFRRLLGAVYDGQLEGRISDRAGALKIAQELGAKGDQESQGSL